MMLNDTPVGRQIRLGSEAVEHFCWPGHADALNPVRCCANPPGDPKCWSDGLTFDLCCTRWLHPRSPVRVDVDETKTHLDVCMRQSMSQLAKSEGCSKSAYFPSEGAPIGRLLFCAVQVGQVKRVFDMFLGSGCSGATALTAMDRADSFGREEHSKHSKLSRTLVGFEDLDVTRARAARSALKTWRPRRVTTGSSGSSVSRSTLHAIAQRLRQGHGKDSSTAWVVSVGLRSNSSHCEECMRYWTVDCPEKCTYQYGAIEAICEGLQGVDLVFWDSDGSAADGWLLEWLSIERACAPRFVLLLNLSLPNHGAWIQERLRALGYQEVWWDAKILHPGSLRDFQSILFLTLSLPFLGK